MSAWSDHRCGAIDDQEFDFLWRRECGDDGIIDDLPFTDDNYEEDAKDE